MRKALRVAAALYIAVIAASVALFFGMRSQTEKYLVNELCQIADTFKNVAETQMENKFQKLKIIADGIVLQNPDDEKEIRANLSQINVNSDGFIEIDFIMPDGEIVTDGGAGKTPTEDFSKEEYFQQVLHGTKAALRIKEDPLGVFSFAVPVVKNGSVVGVLSGTYDMALDNILSLPLLQGAGYADIMDNAGGFLVRHNGPELSGSEKTIEDLGTADSGVFEQVKQNLAGRKSGTYTFKDKSGNKMFAVYTPSEFDGWNIQCVLSASYAYERLSSVTRGPLLFFEATLFLLFALTLIMIWRTYNDHHGRGVQKERYLILEETAHDLLFKYTPQTDSFDYSYLSTDGQMVKGHYDFYLTERKFIEMIHSASCTVWEKTLTMAAARPMRTTVEFLPKNISNGCEWYLGTFQSVADESGQVINVFGRGENIHPIVETRNNAICQAAMDKMTGISNKSAVEEKIAQLLNSRGDTCCALLMIDLDDFKAINDRFGHISGDRALKNFARLLQRVFSAEDVIGRFGGDEFVVFMQNISRENVWKRVEQFRRLLAEQQKDSVFVMTCSIGILYSEKGMDSLEALLRSADDAMYHIKKNGKNGYYFLDASQCS
ncbi:hypothetical protein SDC9_45623 [bioreactor metagenome]|uniref:GGDEF domain-containing protein n=1 Tax=bioreactor metagenome TaxID=1076179 RepID=A0A644W6K8_9ZZZZ